MNPTTIARILDAFHNSSKVLITAHREPDGDSICSQLVVREYLRGLGKECVLYNHGSIPARYRFVAGVDDICTDISSYSFDPDLVVVLEATSLDRTGDVESVIEDGVRIVNIDHHGGNTLYGEINLVDEKASSVGEMIYKILKSDGFVFERSSAENIYIAILTDTGRFHFSSTTPDALRIAAELIESGVNVRRVTDNVYFSKSESQLKTIGEVIQSAEVHLDNKLCALTLTRKLLDRRGMAFSDFEGIVDYSLQINGVEVGVLFRDMSDEVTKVSIRSRNDLDVAEVARRLGGGGHANAAGVTLDMPLDEAKRQIIDLVKELLYGHD
jgi:phosphoesterase RecJ-like protein